MVGEGEGAYHCDGFLGGAEGMGCLWVLRYGDIVLMFWERCSMLMMLCLRES